MMKIYPRARPYNGHSDWEIAIIGLITSTIVTWSVSKVVQCSVLRWICDRWSRWYEWGYWWPQSWCDKVHIHEDYDDTAKNDICLLKIDPIEQGSDTSGIVCLLDQDDHITPHLSNRVMYPDGANKFHVSSSFWLLKFAAGLLSAMAIDFLVSSWYWSEYLIFHALT